MDHRLNSFSHSASRRRRRGIRPPRIPRPERENLDPFYLFGMFPLLRSARSTNQAIDDELRLAKLTGEDKKPDLK